MHRIEIAIYPGFDEVDVAGSFGLLSGYASGDVALPGLSPDRGRTRQRGGSSHR
jgi:hypothetical protein